MLQCKATSEESNREDLTRLLNAALGIRTPNFRNFEETLQHAFESSINRPSLLILDEYPFLRELIPGCDSILQSLVDQYQDKSGLKLVLCGSYLDVMKGLQEYRNPLYGRSGLTLHLQPMDYADSALFYPEFSDEDKVRLYSVFGGIPYYNKQISSKLSVRENIIRLIASPDAVFASEIQYLLSAEIAKNENAERVFEAIAMGFSKFSDILGKSQISGPSALSSILEKLISLGFIRKTYPINSNGSKKRTSYQICDSLTGFYYRCIFRNLSEFSVLPAEIYWEKRIEEMFDTQLVPAVFEDICRQFLIRQNLARRIRPPFFSIGSYWFDLPKERRNGEFDVVTEDENGFTSYECKFWNRPMTEADVAGEISQVRASPLPAQRYGFFSRSGYDGVTENSNRILFTLQDLYSRKITG